MKQVLVLGTGVVALGTINAYAKAGIRVIHLTYKRDDIAGYSRFVAEKHVVPMPPQGEAELLGFLMNSPGDWAGSLLDPVNDPGVVFSSIHHETLSGRFALSIPPWCVVKGIINKSELYQRAYEIGVPAPKIWKFSTMDELRARAGEFDYPCIIKPEQTPAFFEKYNSKVLVTYNLQSLTAQYKDVQANHLDVMVSEIIPGDETCYFLYACHLDGRGEVLAEVCLQKIHQHPATFGVGSVIRTVPMVEEVRNTSLQLLRDRCYTGFSVTELMLDRRDQRYKLIEINTRQVLFVHIFKYLGINFCDIMYADKVEGRAIRRRGYDSDVYWIHPFQEFREYRARRRQSGFSYRSFCAPFFIPRKVLALSPLSDAQPFLRCLSKFVRGMIGKRMLRKLRSEPENITLQS